MIRPDLHLHTNASDGVYDSSQMARLVQKAGVTLFSITDHDTISGLPLAVSAAYDRGLAFIPGVEISTEGDEEIHILGYGVKINDPVLTEAFRDAARDREERILRMSQKLEELGIPVSMDQVRAQAWSSIGRPHLARAMMEKGYVKTTAEAFDKFLGKGKPAYLPRNTMSAAQAISLLRSRGAIPVLAHPGLIRWPLEKLLPMIQVWMDAGLRGIEAYHPANQGSFAYWDRFARQRGLFVTGGSDFHDGGDVHGQIGETAASWQNACADGWALFRACK